MYHVSYLIISYHIISYHISYIISYITLFFYFSVLKIDHSTIGKRSITFNWTDSFNQIRTKYVIRYTKYDAEGRGTEVKLETVHRYITINGLTPYTQYRFTVAKALSMKGATATLVKRTLSDLPSAPLDVTARSNVTWVLLNWQVPLYPNGEIKTYKILYTTDNTQEDIERVAKDVGGKNILFD